MKSEPVELDINKIPELLADKKCSDFVTLLINTAAELFPGRPNSSDALELFELIKNGSGGYFLENISFNGKPAGGGVSGLIINGDAKVFISPTRLDIPVPTPVPFPNENMIMTIQHGYALAGLHETIHHAGPDTYTDKQLATAAHEITGKETNFPAPGETDPFRWGEYWNIILKDNCPPLKRK